MTDIRADVSLQFVTGTATSARETGAVVSSAIA
jgi:hypothetical protein